MFYNLLNLLSFSNIYPAPIGTFFAPFKGKGVVMRGKFHQKLVSTGSIFALFACFLMQAYTAVYAGPTPSAGCQGVEAPTASELSQYPQTELYGLCPAENMAITGILKLRQDSADAVKLLIKKNLFDALKEEALGDQLINRFRIWDHQGYGLEKEWKARSHYGSVFGADHPAAMERLNDFIRERNKHYAELTEDEVKVQKQKENLEYRKELISASQRLTELEHEIKIKDDQLYYLDRDRSPLHPRSSWTQEQMDTIQFEKELLLSQTYFIKDSYPVLQVHLPSRYRPNETVSLAWYLNDLSTSNRIIDGQRPAALIDKYILEATEEAVRHADISIHGDGKEIPGLLDLNYSEENLRKLLLLDGLREKTLDRLDDELVRKVACEIVSTMIPEPSGWTKPTLYFGGMGLACGLGWFVSGPAACLGYVAVTGMAVGVYETAHAIPQALKTDEDYKLIHNFFTSSIEGPSLASSEQEYKTYQDLKNEMWWAWTSGILTAADMPYVMHLVISNARFAKQTFKALRALRQGDAALGESVRESFRMARTLTTAGKNPQIYENLIKLLGEGDIQKIRKFNKFMAGFSKLSPTDQRLVLQYLHDQPSLDIDDLKQYLSAETETVKRVRPLKNKPKKNQLVIDNDAKHVDSDAKKADISSHGKKNVGQELSEEIASELALLRKMVKRDHSKIYQKLLKLAQQGDIQKIRKTRTVLEKFLKLSPDQKRRLEKYLAKHPDHLKKYFASEIDETAAMTRSPKNSAGQPLDPVDPNAETFAQTVQIDRPSEALTTRFDGGDTVKLEKIELAGPTGKPTIHSVTSIRKKQIGNGTNWKTFTHPTDNTKVVKMLNHSARVTYEDIQEIHKLLIEGGYEDVLPVTYNTIKNGEGIGIVIEKRYLTGNEYLKDFGKRPETTRIEEAIDYLRTKHHKDIEFKLPNIGVDPGTRKAVLLDRDELGKFWQSTIKSVTKKMAPDGQTLFEGFTLKLGGPLKKSSELHYGDTIGFITEKGFAVKLGKITPVDDFQKLKPLSSDQKKYILETQRVLIETTDGSRLNITKEFAEALTRQPHVIILPGQSP